MAVPMVSSCKFCRGGHFWRFQMFRCFVSRGKRGTSWHSRAFSNASKIVLCGKRNTFATFSEDALQFSWQAQHFGRVHRHFSWQAQHFRRVVLRVFCKSHWQGCVNWRQVANSVAGVAFCEMCWKLTEASHETLILMLQNLEVPTKTRRKTSILKILKQQSVKLEEVSHEMLVLVLPPVSSRVIGFLVASPCLWGKLQNISFSKVAKQVVMSFCVAGAAWRGTLWQPNLFDNVSKMSKLEEVSHEMLVFMHPRVSSRVAGFPVT